MPTSNTTYIDVAEGDPLVLSCPVTTPTYLSRAWYTGIVSTTDHTPLFSQSHGLSPAPGQGTSGFDVHSVTFDLSLGSALISKSESVFTCSSKDLEGTELMIRYHYFVTCVYGG